MNKGRQPMTARQEKKTHKEVRKGMKEETPAAKVPKALKADSAKKVKPKHPPKKTSKRTSPWEKIEGSTPAHVHTENEHWATCIRSQSLLKASRLKKKLAKRQTPKGRMR